MDLKDIERIIKVSEIIISNDLETDNKYKIILNKILKFVVDLKENYENELNQLVNSNIRFSDYYDITSHGDDILKYILDKKELIDVFLVYVFLKNVDQIILNFDTFDSLDELFEVLDNVFFEDLLYVMKKLEERRIERVSQIETGFLPDSNKYKILFSGLVHEDVRNLEKNVKKAFIRKINDQLSTSDYVNLSEGVDHVRDKYNFPLLRIQVANDYRIAYIRKETVTVILGVTIKTGKDSDYTRYDKIAIGQELIYKEINAFLDGTLPSDSPHYQTYNYLLDFYNKEMKNKQV